MDRGRADERGPAADQTGSAVHQTGQVHECLDEGVNDGSSLDMNVCAVELNVIADSKRRCLTVESMSSEESYK